MKTKKDVSLDEVKKMKEQISKIESKLEQQIEAEQEVRKIERRRQDILRSISDSVPSLSLEEDIMDTKQPSNMRFKKDGLKKVDLYIKDLEKRVDQLLDKIDSEKQKA